MKLPFPLLINMRTVRGCYMSTLAFGMVFHLAISPLYKYGEYVFDLPRLNATGVSLSLVVMAVFFLLARVAGRESFYLDQFLVLASILIVWVCFLHLVQLPFLIEEVGFVEFGKYASRTMIGALLLFLIGVSFFSLLSGFRIYLNCAWLISALVYILGFLKSQGWFIYLDGEQIYLMLADSFAILSIMVLFLTRSLWARVSVAALSTLLLFSLVSRASFVFFIASVFFVLLRRRLDMAIAFFAVAAAFISFFWTKIVTVLGESNRMIRLVTTGQDSSLSARSELFAQELNHLGEHWLLGRYMYDVLATGTTGTYGHNYLSFATAFGVLPFSVAVGLLLVSLVVGLKRLPSDPLCQAFYCILVFVFLEVVFARGYLHTYVWLVIGGGSAFLRRAAMMNNIQESRVVNNGVVS